MQPRRLGGAGLWDDIVNTTDSAAISGYNHYFDEGDDQSHDILLPAVKRMLGTPAATDGRLFDLGCGNGSFGAQLASAGWQVSGVDPSVEGITAANARYPGLDLHFGSAYDDLPAKFGQFDRVISLEVVEHVYAPREWAKSLFDLTRPGGIAIVSTPYHGYLKNLAIVLLGGFDRHMTALWDHGHIKFWSIETLSILLREAGFDAFEIERVGRIPALAKSMVFAARRPR